MKHSASNNEVLIISSYPPRACGIATYSHDLLNALRNTYGHTIRFSMCALEDGPMQLAYNNDVKMVLDTSQPESYEITAQRINNNKNIRAVMLQHEFGLFSGHYGTNLLHLLEPLEKPVITTFHSVLPHPDEQRKAIIGEIASQSEKLIVMTHQSEALLVSHYDIAEEMISVIPHGTHVPPLNNKDKIRQKLGLKDRLVLSTFGLLSPNKSIETALEALPAIKKKFPNVLYLVLGKTHPGIVKQDGETYREFLEAKAKALDIEDNVQFVNRYLDLSELLEYLMVTDIYLFTSKDPHQAVSGTFAYAMSAGCPIISTSIPHALEVLDDSTGKFVDFEAPEQLAAAAIKLLSKPSTREYMTKNALNRTRPTHWVNVALHTGQLFNKHLASGQSAVLDYPHISLDHIKRMTTKTGIIQFSNLSIPDPESGYTLDDNARALIAMLQHYELYPNANMQWYIGTYLRFIERCQQPDGTFLNYLNAENRFTAQNQYINLEDSNGRAIWALGRMLATEAEIAPLLLDQAEAILQRYVPHVPSVTSPRARAFIIKGLHDYNRSRRLRSITHLIDDMASKLVEQYHDVSKEKWHWFEEYLTYANSTLPQALLLAYLETGKGAYQIIARLTFDFLLSHLFSGDQIKVISNNGWFHYNGTRQEYGEQPIDVAYTIEALELFYEVFNDNEYRKKMDIAFSWFLGNNHLQQSIYNHTTGGCYDGLEEHNVNLNQGAESTVCYLMARLTLERQLIPLRPTNLPAIPSASEISLLQGFRKETPVSG